MNEGGRKGGVWREGERGERKGETSTPILTMGKNKHIL